MAAGGPPAVAERGPEPAARSPRALELAAALLARHADNQPTGEDHLRFTLACNLRDLGLDEAEALASMAWWNQECAHPRDTSEIEKAVTNAYAYARDSAPGSAAVPSAAEAFAGLLSEPEPEPEDPTARANKALREAGVGLRVATLRELKDAPDPGWLVEGAIPMDGLTALYGPPKRGKTFAAVDLACSVAAGRPWFGQWEVLSRGPVVYFALEGAYDARARMLAWQEHYKVDIEADILMVEGLLPIGEAAQVEAAVGAALAVMPHPALVIVDTFARAISASGMDENLARDQGRAAMNLERMGYALRCPILAIVHTGKDKERGMRGSNALLGAAAAAVSSDIDAGVLRLMVEEVRRGAPGKRLEAVIASGGEHPVWRGREPLQGSPRPIIDRRQLVRRAFMVAVIRAATSANDAETVSRAEFFRRVQAHLYGEFAMPLAQVRIEAERLLDSHPVLRGKLLADKGRIAILGRDERAALFVEANTQETLDAATGT